MKRNLKIILITVFITFIICNLANVGHHCDIEDCEMVGIIIYDKEQAIVHHVECEYGSPQFLFYLIHLNNPSYSYEEIEEKIILIKSNSTKT